MTFLFTFCVTFAVQSTLCLPRLFFPRVCPFSSAYDFVNGYSFADVPLCVAGSRCPVRTDYMKLPLLCVDDVFAPPPLAAGRTKPPLYHFRLHFLRCFSICWSGILFVVLLPAHALSSVRRCSARCGGRSGCMPRHVQRYTPPSLLLVLRHHCLCIVLLSFVSRRRVVPVLHVTLVAFFRFRICLPPRRHSPLVLLRRRRVTRPSSSSLMPWCPRRVRCSRVALW